MIRLSAHDQTVELAWSDDTDHIPQRIAENQDWYERPLLDHIYETAGEGAIVDVGAHIGNHTLWFAGIMRRRVLAFEPHPASYIQLVANVDANGLRHLVETRGCAVGAEPGTARLEYVGATNLGSATYRPDPQGTTPVTTLDIASVELGRVAAVKIDVEGAEVDVLEGAKTLIAEQHPLLYVEDRDDTLTAVHVLMDAYGYERFGVWGKTPMTGWKPK